jgi:hypothetical protein
MEGKALNKAPLIWIKALGNRSPSAHPEVEWAGRILGFAAMAAVTVYVMRIARKALAEAVPD